MITASTFVDQSDSQPAWFEGSRRSTSKDLELLMNKIHLLIKLIITDQYFTGCHNLTINENIRNQARVKTIRLNIINRIKTDNEIELSIEEDHLKVKCLLVK